MIGVVVFRRLLGLRSGSGLAVPLPFPPELQGYGDEGEGGHLPDQGVAQGGAGRMVWECSEEP